MNRRGFLKMLVGGVAVAAAAPSFPFRVFSFPSDVVQPADYYLFSGVELAKSSDAMMARIMEPFFDPSPFHFLAMAQRRALPANINKNVNFFNYEHLS